MYPRNAASPERIAVGAIYLIADGTIQTTGASVRVMPQGGAAAGGGGTLACDATSGIWHYIPTQAETNYASFMVLVYKASCTSASATVVTTASATPGTVKLFDGAHGGSSASFAFGAGGTISNASGDALAISATGGNNSGMVLTGSGNGSGLDIASGTSLNANGMTVTSNASSVKGYGLLVTGAVAGAGIRAISSGTGPGMELLGGTNGNALTLTPNGSGYGLSGNIQGNLSGSVGSLTTWHASVTDWTDGGRLDSILDTIAAENGSSFTNIPTQNANMIQINGTTIPGTGSQVAEAFEYFFNVVTPAKTINDCGVAGAGLTAEDVWTYATRVLTASTNFNDISASDVRTELAVELARIDAAVSSRSSHDAAAVLTAFGTGAALTACLTGGDATAANQAAISGLISALNNLSSGDVSAALATYDGPTNAEMTAAFTEIKGATWDSATDTLELIRNAAGSGGSGGLTPLASGTAQSGTTNTIRLAAASTFADDDLIGAIINITGGSGAGQHRVIYDYVAATDTAYVSPDWNTAVASDSTYEVVPGASNVTLVGGSIPVESDSVPAKLTADGLDNIPITAPSGAATDFREMLVQVWRRFFKRANRTYSGGTKTIKTYADDGTTVLTTQVIADDGTTEEQGVAS